MKEAQKAARRRACDPRYDTWIKGEVLDIGGGDAPVNIGWYPKVSTVVNYDIIFDANADAQTLGDIPDNCFDTVHSSHCLEHVEDPVLALGHWLRVLRPRGYLVVTIPEWNIYEHQIWPPQFNADHRTAWVLTGTPRKEDFLRSVTQLLNTPTIPSVFDVMLIQKIDTGFDYSRPVEEDQTFPENGPECAIEFVLRKIK